MKPPPREDAKGSTGRFRRAVGQKSADYRSRGSVMIVALGDSVTMGATANGVIEPASVYHRRVRRALESRHPQAVFSVINSGIGQLVAPMAQVAGTDLENEPGIATPSGATVAPAASGRTAIPVSSGRP